MACRFQTTTLMDYVRKCTRILTACYYTFFLSWIFILAVATQNGLFNIYVVTPGTLNSLS